MAQLIGVPLPIKHLLLGAWVQSRQLLQQPVATTSLPSEAVVERHSYYTLCVIFCFTG